MKIEHFDSIYERASLRKGGASALEALLPAAKTPDALKRVADARVLAEMSACIFRSGFVWRIIENKWPAFEDAFNEFDVVSCAMLNDEDLEQLCSNAAIVRHPKKIAAVRENARYLLEVREEYGSFGKFLAAWPEDDFKDLWLLLKKRGNRLGGHTGQYFLRFIGRDTPVFSKDVVSCLVQQGIVEKEPTSNKALGVTQDAFNIWRAQSGRSFCQISRVLACSVDQ